MQESSYVTTPRKAIELCQAYKRSAGRYLYNYLVNNDLINHSYTVPVKKTVPFLWFFKRTVLEHEWKSKPIFTTSQDALDFITGRIDANLPTDYAVIFKELYNHVCRIEKSAEAVNYDSSNGTVVLSQSDMNILFNQ